MSKLHSSQATQANTAVQVHDYKRKEVGCIYWVPWKECNHVYIEETKGMFTLGFEPGFELDSTKEQRSTVVLTILDNIT